ncbi:hypothetical protein [Aquisediminimonas profunda]|uniref:hypothetical protein n=1 Tax=Aquisediminimonas profunda TaxID=1550733 RepID=UPI001C63A656|nr:hypothetical protein [Aquisediminimonas profunda]
MTIQRKLSAGIVAAALLANASSPALARDYDRDYGYGYGHHGWHHRHDHVDGGDVVAGVALIAILAAVLSSSSKNRSHVGHSQGDIDSEDAAVDACAQAAEAKAGEQSNVRDITQVDRTSDGWNVEGTITRGTDWNTNDDEDDDDDSRHFTCTVRYGAVQDVMIENGSIALN